MRIWWPASHMALFNCHILHLFKQTHVDCQQQRNTARKVLILLPTRPHRTEKVPQRKAQRQSRGFFISVGQTFQEETLFSLYVTYLPPYVVREAAVSSGQTADMELMIDAHMMPINRRWPRVSHTDLGSVFTHNSGPAERICDAAEVTVWPRTHMIMDMCRLEYFVWGARSCVYFQKKNFYSKVVKVRNHKA